MIEWFSDILNVAASPNVTIVSRLSPQDILSRSSDLKAIQIAIEKGYKVSILENLHAKICNSYTLNINTGNFYYF